MKVSALINPLKRVADPAEIGAECSYDPNDNGTLVGLNPALMSEGD